MERRIVFVRHVSSPHPTGVADIDRPIDEEGREDAARIMAHLEQQGWRPERVLSSSARRTKETWGAMYDAASDPDWEPHVEFSRDIYRADIDDLCGVIWGLPAETSTVLVVGHNPGISDTVSWLTGVRSRMPKGGVAVLRCSGDDWQSAVQQGRCELEAFVRPAELRSGGES